MKIVFFGLGSIGQRHARLLQSHFKHELFALRSGKGQASSVPGITDLKSWKAVEALKADIAFITNPTACHVETALRCARLGMHLFIEKPLSMDLHGIDELRAVCQEKRITNYVAYCLRFHPVIEKVRSLLEGKAIYHARSVCASFLPKWRKGQDYSKHYSAKRDQGGGIILELSHEFDYVHYLFGPIQDIRGKFGQVSNLKIDAEDYVDAVISTASGSVINLHMNYFSQDFKRMVEVDFEDGYVHGNLAEFIVRYVYQGKEQVFEFEKDVEKFFTKQLEYFFAQIGKTNCMNSVQEAKGLLEKIVQFRDTYEEACRS